MGMADTWVNMNCGSMAQSGLFLENSVALSRQGPAKRQGIFISTCTMCGETWDVCIQLQMFIMHIDAYVHLMFVFGLFRKRARQLVL